MSEVLSRCGYRCDLCLAWRPNMEANPTNAQVLSDGWHRYFGFRIPAEKIICDGCLAEDPQLIDTACPVRPCVSERRLASCAECGDYICPKLTERLVTYDEIAARIGHAIPQEDRARFIAPYENRARLKTFRGD